MQDRAQVNRRTVAGPVYVISDCLPNVFATGGKRQLFSGNYHLLKTVAAGGQTCTFPDNKNPIEGLFVSISSRRPR